MLHNPDFCLKNTYVQIYTGAGKGKTTASIGLATRHVGQGGSVLYTQFCKGDKDAFPSGEKAFFRLYSFLKGNKFEHHNFGSRYKWELPENITQDDINQAFKDFSYVVDNHHKFTLVVLDEIAHALSCGLVSDTDVLFLIDNCKDKTELVLTGRNFPESILDKAHLITEMKPIKHYWNIKVKARKGIEY